MEGNNQSHMIMGDIILSPSPLSPHQHHNFGVSSGTTAASLAIVGTCASPTSSAVSGRGQSVIFIPQIITHHVAADESDEEHEQEQVAGGHVKKKVFRKRKKSVHTGNDMNYIPPYKLRRMYVRRHASCPSGSSLKSSLKFLLGGNAHDPLNLNGLGDSDNAMTPKTSPMPLHFTRQGIGEIPILIPKNYQDPLRLLADEDVENTRDVIVGVLTAKPPEKKRKRHRKRSSKKRNESECSAASHSPGDGRGAEEDAIAVITENNIQELRDDVVESDGTPTLEKDDSKITKGGLQVRFVEPNADEEKNSFLSSAISEPECQEKESKDFPEELVEKNTENGTGGNVGPNYFRSSSDYIPLSSHYQPSPFVLDTMNENFTVLPFESPSMSNYMGTQDTFTITEPFSPPPLQRNQDVIIEHRVPSGHYLLFGYTPPRHEIQERRQLPQPPTITQQAMFNRRSRNRLDPIVSPVFPNLVGGKRHLRHHHHHYAHKKTHPQNQEAKNDEKITQTSSQLQREEIKVDKPEKKYRAKDRLFQYGNYNQYYGYRNQGHMEDPRLRVFKTEWFEGKDVLDIGCNIGHITLSIARDHGPRRIVGLDIDAYLIKVANKNVKHYVDRDPNDVSIKFPVSLSLVHGSLQPPQLDVTREALLRDIAKTGNLEEAGGRIPFPHNVSFRHGNYVLEHDDLLRSVKPEFDAILCLSTTKWVHLNFGDDGLKRFFRRAFLSLRPGGYFIMEPQPWSSYTKKKKLTEHIFKTYNAIKFLPKDFESYLLKDVGYGSVQLVGTPTHYSKGFQRPIYVFSKPGEKQKSPTETETEVTEGISSSER